VLAVDAVGIAAGAAGANGGFLLAGLARFHHEAVAALGRDAAVDWYRRTLAELDRLEQREPTFRRVGSVRTAADDAEGADIAAHLAALRADDLPGEPYDGPSGTGLLVPGDGTFHPVARCRRLAVAAREAGATLVAPARVTAVGPGAVHVAGLGAPVQTDRVLVAVDGVLERLVPSLAGRVRTARLQMLATAPLREVVVDRPVYHRGGLDYVQQRPGGEVLLGGGRDVGGAAEWAAPADPSPPVQAHLDRWLRALGVTAPVTHRWAAHAAFTPDGLPIDERIAHGVHVVGAYSGHGNVLGGLLARGAALDLLDGRGGPPSAT
jgi:glycine/D-amino acid oxidase-like deaminating enzyme